MRWSVVSHDDFEPELAALPQMVQDALIATALVLQEVGPLLGRPHVDTLNGSKHPNMKELRFNAADGVWRVAFAFDPDRMGILLVAGDKTGVAQKRFYKALVAKADRRFTAHLEDLKGK
jgi:hypothetical protein